MKTAKKRVSALTIAPVLLAATIASAPSTASAACHWPVVQLPTGAFPNEDCPNGPTWEETKKRIEQIVHDRLQRGEDIFPCPGWRGIGHGRCPRLPPAIF